MKHGEQNTLSVSILRASPPLLGASASVISFFSENSV